ncbi:TPM domain-containing protein [Erythrobacter sp. EC-HK427]|uniref:TPM domain-containing protein n=1 Tax=Erythrobacter sp. EC-HK427 TaxID=2038396 RepID=UPI0012527A32|nr:TPM domain-containing protein [Erythrobacter sp. EC-HK427]VVT20506.1 Membrane protein [Erythrobacter sp. EC-HK427]
MGYLNEAQHQLVSAAVAEAELSTSGEIVPVIADRSDGYTDVILVWAIAAAFTAMSIFAAFPDVFLSMVDWLLGGWTHEWTYGEVIAWAVGIGLVTFVAVWALLSWDALRFVCVPSPIKAQRVRMRAVRHFKVGAEGRTKGKTGIMLYLSMREHRAEIVADNSIASLVPAEVWGEAMADMLAEIRKGCVAEGIAAGVRDVGKVLAEHFPRGEDDDNELPDRLIEV